MIDLTWMPYASISRSVKSLKDEQIESAWVAGYQTLRTLLGCHNPVASVNRRLWNGYEVALSNYCVALLSEIRTRRLTEQYEHELFWALIEDAPRVQAYERRFKSRSIELPLDLLMTSTTKLSELRLLPKWFGWHPLHSSHRTALKSEDVSKLVWPWRESGEERKSVSRAVGNPDGKARFHTPRTNRGGKALAS